MSKSALLGAPRRLAAVGIALALDHDVGNGKQRKSRRRRDPRLLGQQQPPRVERQHLRRPTSGETGQARCTSRDTGDSTPSSTRIPVGAHHRFHRELQRPRRSRDLRLRRRRPVRNGLHLRPVAPGRTRRSLPGHVRRSDRRRSSAASRHARPSRPTSSPPTARPPISPTPAPAGFVDASDNPDHRRRHRRASTRPCLARTTRAAASPFDLSTVRTTTRTSSGGAGAGIRRGSPSGARRTANATDEPIALPVFPGVGPGGEIAPAHIALLDARRSANHHGHRRRPVRTPSTPMNPFSADCRGLRGIPRDGRPERDQLRRIPYRRVDTARRPLGETVHVRH